MHRFEYFKPQTVQEAITLMEKFKGEAMYVAGGTDVMVQVRQKKVQPKALISLRNIKELSYRDGPVLGSATTHREIEKDEFARKNLSALHDAVCRLGSTQIRNVATVAGNICNAAPSADTACPLLVLDARLTIAGPQGERQVDLDEFFVGPSKTVMQQGELVKEIRMPSFGVNTGSAYIKHTRRQAMDLPIVGVAARMTLNRSDVRCKDMLCTVAPMSQIFSLFAEEELRCDEVRIAMGVVAPRPMRAKKAEAVLKGKVLSDKLVLEASEIAASEASPRDSIRGEAWYRSEMVKVLVKRAIMKAIDRIVRPDELFYPERLW
jgi:carbon-monoxide dehydrogenase medium subunit